MDRRQFIRNLSIGVAALSTTTYFDVGKNLWRTNRDIVIVDETFDTTRFREMMEMVVKHMHEKIPDEFYVTSGSTLEKILKSDNNSNF